MFHELPELPYAHDALEPHIDRRTMEIHHGKHHAGYVKKLNDAIDGHEELQQKTLIELLRDLGSIPDEARDAVRNSGGGHFNHSLFWKTMKPEGGGRPEGELSDAIQSTFGSFGDFKQRFSEAAAGRFGSGWAWLFLEDGRLQVDSTPNQDTPLMRGGVPLLGLDVWEHAYYLKYQNRRREYIAAWWNLVDWDVVARNFKQGRAGS
jgi:Fe-Mn family superoxide dismutase